MTPSTTTDAVGADRPHPHRDVARLRPVGRVRLGDAQEVGRRLREVGHPHPLRDPAAVRRGRRLGEQPMAASSPLHTAMACRVPMWFCTERRRRDGQLGVVRAHVTHLGAHGAEVRRLAREQHREGALAQRSRGHGPVQGVGVGHAPRVPIAVPARASVWRCPPSPSPVSRASSCPPRRTGRAIPGARCGCWCSTTRSGCCSSSTPTSASTRYPTGG